MSVILIFKISVTYSSYIHFLSWLLILWVVSGIKMEFTFTFSYIITKCWFYDNYRNQNFGEYFTMLFFKPHISKWHVTNDTDKKKYWIYCAESCWTLQTVVLILIGWILIAIKSVIQGIQRMNKSQSSRVSWPNPFPVCSFNIQCSVCRNHT